MGSSWIPMAGRMSMRCWRVSAENTPSTGTSWRKSYRVMKSSGIPSARTGQKSGPTRGHSVQVDVELPVTEPPETLYHGTARRFAASIEAQGLLRSARLYVHLSPDQETAEKVGRRHGEPVIYLVDAGQMHRDGYLFYLSANGVWLTKVVPATYLKRLEGELKQH